MNKSARIRGAMGGFLWIAAVITFLRNDKELSSLRGSVDTLSLRGSVATEAIHDDGRAPRACAWVNAQVKRSLTCRAPRMRGGIYLIVLWIAALRSQWQ